MGANKEEVMVKPINRCEKCGQYRRTGLIGYIRHVEKCPQEKIGVITDLMTACEIMTRREYDRRLTNKEK